MKVIRKYFITGTLIVVPIIITVYLLIGMFRFLDGILGRLINKLLLHYFDYSIPGLGIIFGILLIFFTGFFATHLISKKALSFWENWFTKFPIIRHIYPASKQVINFLFKDAKLAFEKTVLVEYPRKGIYSLGFITNEGAEVFCQKTNKNLVNVFIPSTPSPLTGFFCLIPKEEIIFIDINVEDALKMIVSGGVVNPHSQGNQPIA